MIPDLINAYSEPLTDEVAFAVSEVLHSLAIAHDEQYYAQIHRYMRAREEERSVVPGQPWHRK